MRAVRYTVDPVATTAAWASLALGLYLLPHAVFVLALQRWRPADPWARSLDVASAVALDALLVVALSWLVPFDRAVLGVRVLAALALPLGERSYRVHVGPLRGLAGEVASRSIAVLVTDATVARHWGDAAAIALGGSAARVVLRPGERSKTLRSVARVWDAAGARGADRRGVIACVGGGAGRARRGSGCRPAAARLPRCGRCCGCRSRR